MTTIGSVLAIIPARGGSKGVPRKNVLKLGEKPLIAHTIAAALSAPSVTRVVVTTDDQEIASVSLEAGAEVPFMRPHKLANDTAGMIDTVIHAIKMLEKDGKACCEVVALLQPTSPLRTPEEIEGALAFMSATEADSIISVSRSESSHPYYQYYLNAGYPEPVLGVPKNLQRRQDYPEVYIRNGSIYLTNRDVIINSGSLYGEKLRAYVTMPETSVNIDTFLDFRFAEFLLSNAK